MAKQQQHQNYQPIGTGLKVLPAGRSSDVPHSQEAEEAVLGAVLINPKSYILVAGFLEADDFFFLRNGYVWQAMGRLHTRQDDIDVVTLSAELDGLGYLDDIGGKAYLMQLIAITPTSVHGWTYGQIVKRTAARRKLMKAADEMRLLAQDEHLNVNDVVDRAYGVVDDATQSLRLDDVDNVADALHEHMDSIESKRSQKDQFSHGVPTGLRDLDAMIGGWHKRKLCVVGGRKHMGKTGFMVTSALHALRHGAVVLFANCADGSKRDVMNNFLSMEANIAPHKIDAGLMDDEEYSRYIEACGRLSRMKLLIYSKKGMTTHDLYMRAASIKQEHGLDAIFLDYFQRMMPSENAPRYVTSSGIEKMNWISQKLTQMIDSDWLNVPLIMGAQINRAGSGKSAPTLENLKGTGNIEEDADVGIIIHRPGYYDAGFEDQDLTEVIVEKNKVTRDLGKIQSRTDRISARFDNWR